jgi:hypothetical protein
MPELLGDSRNKVVLMEIEATRLETDEEVRQALLKYRPAVRPGVAAHREPAPPDDAPPLFRPTERPPTPVLVVFDDGAEDGETIRIRKDRFAIGRTEGDLVIPNDNQMSARHAELKRSTDKEKHRWHLVDLKSTNGTYVRIGHAVLEHGQEFIIGRTRLCFEHPSAERGAARPSNHANQGTIPWRSGVQDSNAPSLVQVNAAGGSPRVLITQRDFWLGKDAGYCQLVIGDDPFVSARHARIQQDQQGRWIIENNKSPNGVWLRIQRLPIGGTCRFLLGEQQFMVRIS